MRIFPLVLTPIENFLLADDRPRYPMAFVIDLQLAGQLERGAFEQALAEAVRRHPLLQCFIRPAKRQQLCWVSAQDTQPYVHWGREGEPIELPGSEWINLHDEVGLRVWVRQGADQVQLTFQFHHVCCDGIGAYRFLGDLLALYGRETAEDPTERPEVGTVDPVRLRGRANGCGYLDREDRRMRQIRESILFAMKIFGGRCDPLRPSQPGHTTPQFPGYSDYSFSEAETAQLREAARHAGGMLNDLLLAELFNTMDNWNRQHGSWLRGGKYRIMMPVDLRDTVDFETPAANVIGYSFVAQRSADLADRKRLVLAVREETARIKHDLLAQRFVDMVSVGAGSRGLMPRLLATPRTLATVILSNIGDPTRRFLAKFKRRKGCVLCGNLTLLHISGFPPIRCKTRGSFSIVTYRKQLTIGLRCDPHLFSLDDSQQMLDIFVGQLRALLGS